VVGGGAGGGAVAFGTLGLAPGGAVTLGFPWESGFNDALGTLGLATDGWVAAAAILAPGSAAYFWSTTACPGVNAVAGGVESGL
jgi:hypothetical protein